MNIKFVGTGGYNHIDCGNSAALLELNGKTILIDCGSSVYERLARKGLIDAIDYVLLTHLHGDHVGSLFSLVCHMMRGGGPNRPVSLLCPNDSFAQKVRTFLHCQFGTVTDEVVQLLPLETVPGIEAIDTKGHHLWGMFNYAYLFEDDDEYMYYSGDVNTVSVAAQVVGRCTDKSVRVFHDTTFREGCSSHTYYKEIEQELADYDVYGYHCDHAVTPADCQMKLVGECEELLV